jgi:hypothetical protein
MVDESHDRPAGPASDLVWIDAVADRFEKAWRETGSDSSTWPRLEAYCDQAND